MTRAVGILVLSAAVALSGCSGSDSASTSTSASTASSSASAPPTAALTPKGASTFYATFDKAYAAALTKADTGSFARSGLASVLSSPALDAAAFVSRYREVSGSSQRATTKHTRVKVVYAAPATAGADAVVVGVERSGEIEGRLEVLRRGSPDARWTRAMDVEAALGSVAAPAAAAKATPSTEDRALARTIVRRVMAYVDGGSSSGLIPSAAIAHVRDFDTDLPGVTVTKKTTFWGPAMKDVTAPGGPVVVVRTTTGLLIVAAAELAETVRNTNGTAISYKAPFDRLFRVSGGHPSMTDHYGVVMAITVKDGAKPIVAGASSYTVMPPNLR